MPHARVVKFADFVIYSAVFLYAFALLYFVYFYGWAPEKYFPNPIAALLYYILAISVGLLLVSLRLEPDRRATLALSLLSIILSIYILELLLTLSAHSFNATTQTARMARELGVDFDMRDKFQVIADLKKQGICTSPSINAENLLEDTQNRTRRSMVTINGIETLPLTGIANRLTVYCNESGSYVMYESDEHGFHNPKGIWDAAHIDIVAVGDSFTQGFCVPSDKNAVALIRRHYPATLNLGAASNGPLTELATMKEYLPSLKPRIVLWFYFEGNDLVNLVREKQSPLLMSYLRENFTQNLLHQQTEIDSALTAFVEAPSRTVAQTPEIPPLDRTVRRLLVELRGVIKLERLRSRLGFSPVSTYEAEESAANLELFEKILLQGKALVDTWGGKLYFIYLPEWLRYAYPNPARRNRDRVLTMVRLIGIPTVDLHPAFQVHGDPLALFPFRQDNHYNERGYRLVAEEVLRSIASDYNSQE
jgi:hypothetical protein